MWLDLVMTSRCRSLAKEQLASKLKLLDHLQFVPNLAHNLLGIGQLMSSGYKIEFDSDMCNVIDNNSGHCIANIHMTQNRMFPLDVSNALSSKALVVKRKFEIRTFECAWFETFKSKRNGGWTPENRKS